jgi:hypothetical protein
MKLASVITKETKTKMKDAYFIGRLVTDDDLATTLLDTPVKFDEWQDEVTFYIKCLTEIPESISKHFAYQNKIFTGSTKSKNNFRKFNEWFNYDVTPHFDKQEKVKTYLHDKLIVFTITDNGSYGFAEIHKVENIEMIAPSYVPIPGPDLKTNENRDMFEEKIAKTSKPITLPKYPNLFDPPEYILLEGRLYETTLKASLNPVTYNPSIDDGPSIKYLDIKDRIIDYVSTRIDDHLYFVSKDDYYKLFNEMKQHGKYLYNKLAEREMEKEEEIKEEKAELTTRVVNQNDELKEEAPSSNYNKGEIDFLNKLKENAKERGLFYKDIDLYSFHISAKTNPLTILGGLSGTGKTQLALLYGETLGLQQGSKDLVLIPISPSYHEPNDILGYLNPTTGVYHESETGLVKLLLNAKEYDDRLYMCIFDEANLSQVEHWFSPFISLLEMESDTRELTLFNEKSYCVNDMYKPKVQIGDNIIFVGTVNFDETTKSFSDRLLDRTNVITPSKMSFAESKEIAKLTDKKEINSSNVGRELYRDKWVKKNVGLKSFTEDEINILDEMHDCLYENDIQKGVSFRVALSIALFIENIPANENGELLIKRDEAFDLQIKQRVLTKVKGLESFVSPLVGNYMPDRTYEEGALTKILTSPLAQKISTFKHSIQLLKNKAKELRYNGYAN